MLTNHCLNNFLISCLGTTHQIPFSETFEKLHTQSTNSSFYSFQSFFNSDSHSFSFICPAAHYFNLFKVKDFYVFLAPSGSECWTFGSHSAGHPEPS